ncbi:MAG: cytochrome P450 [Actinomycetota bacterium]|nr:cytochrome P450 [Actinomycetota bacterium]
MLPPGPRQSPAMQMIGFWSRPTAFLERCRRRYGKRFTLRIIGAPPFVALSEPDQIKQLFSAPPEILHPGEGAQILEPILGANSVLLLDEALHLEQRRLMLPAFHGEHMQGLAGLMSELAERELAAWPRDEAVALHPRLQRLTLEIILRAAFGLEQSERMEMLRVKLTQVLAFAESPISLLPPRIQRLPVGSPGRLQRLLAEVDALVFEQIDERRRAAADGDGAGDDILAMLLVARHEDGSPMSSQELRDELITALVAGHETTASQLAWAFERLAREPAALTRVVSELDNGSGEEYLTATIQEVMRRRPVVLNAEPRLAKEQVEIGGWTYPRGVSLLASIWLVHHDEANYCDPYAFRPERFLERQPGTYTWIPFGGGRRRCLGASFAMLEMKTVLRAVLERCELRPPSLGAESARRRSITISPSGGATVILHDRARGTRPVAAEPLALTTSA